MYDICGSQEAQSYRCPFLEDMMKEHHIFRYHDTRWGLNFTDSPTLSNATCVHIRLDDHLMRDEIDLNSALMSDILDNRTISQFRYRHVKYNETTFQQFAKQIVNGN